MEWISVKERMPTPTLDCSYYQESEVVIFTNGASALVGYVQVYKSTQVEKPSWFIELRSENEEVREIHGVTHWMPLPALPTRKGDERKGD